MSEGHKRACDVPVQDAMTHSDHVTDFGWLLARRGLAEPWEGVGLNALNWPAP